jgi:hypothetical protein
MKKFLFAFSLMVSALSLSSCRDEDNLPYPKTEEYPIIFTNVTASESAYKLSDIAGTGNPTATFSIDVKGGDASKVDYIEVYRSFRGYNVAATPALGLGPRVLLRTVPPTSATLEVTLNDMINGLTRPTGSSQTGARTAITRASLKENEGFLVTYELVLKDQSRVVYTPTSAAGVVSGTSTNAPYSGSVTIIKQ